MNKDAFLQCNSKFVWAEELSSDLQEFSAQGVSHSSAKGHAVGYLQGKKGKDNGGRKSSQK